MHCKLLEVCPQNPVKDCHGRSLVCGHYIPLEKERQAYKPYKKPDKEIFIKPDGKDLVLEYFLCAEKYSCFSKKCLRSHIILKNRLYASLRSYFSKHRLCLYIFLNSAFANKLMTCKKLLKVFYDILI